MNEGILFNLYKGHPKLMALGGKLPARGNEKFHLEGLKASARALAAAHCMQVSGDLHVFVMTGKEEAAYFFNDLANILGEENLAFFPASYKRSIQFYQPDNENIVLRTSVLERIINMKKEGQQPPFLGVVSYPEALAEKVITHQKLTGSTLALGQGDNISQEFLQEVLAEYGFQRVDFVYEPGQYSIRGSIVDVFSFSSEKPYRVDFFGDEVETIRTFDIESQLSSGELQKISIIPNIQQTEITGTRETFFDYLPVGTIAWSNDFAYITTRVNEIYENTDFANREDYTGEDKPMVLTTGNEIMAKVTALPAIEFGNNRFFEPSSIATFDTSLQPYFHKNFELLAENLVSNTEHGYQNYILSDNEKQIERLQDIFSEVNGEVQFTPVPTTVHEGFIDHDQKICCYTDHQIFERYHKFRLHKRFSKKEALSISRVTDLHPGDYVVHIDHGIGKFGGLEKIEVNGKVQEAIKLVYRDNDILYVSIHSLHRVSKYKGKDSEPPKIYKLGSGAWQKVKNKTKSKVKDIAKDLIYIYAQRRAQKGFAFSTDTYVQQELEASFIFEDTPDQEKATRSVKENMEADHPMDMLVCGDVGFGKTEVAVRAAFKAVADNKQVAVLVPTTILALQHYNTFKERLVDFPCTVDYISRLKSTAQQRETIKRLKEGKLDIVIGTHRLVSKDMGFKDLGLLIIDEEQKFGVAVKEKLKKLKLNVDTLTMTATPIPRTLQFSLMGARDLAVINTPPPNRHPILTEVHPFHDEIIKEAIQYEVERDGQVFFIHNRVQNIGDIEARVQRAAPGVSTVVAHGQMEGKKLEQIMLDFISGKYDVLIATTIIESGLDIPNANTIIINDAHHYGVSDLHQLRGRVGRSNKKAFCYLLSPPLQLLTPEARRRLTAIEDFSDLGSGFNIAMQDLDIRGAGNMLGSEQSGFISDIGFETYQRILQETMQELREEEFKDLFAEKEKQAPPAALPAQKFMKDCHIDTDLEILFPDDYINNIAERIRLYRELDNLEDEKQLNRFEHMLVDRFGHMPPPVKGLIDIVRVRWIGEMLGFEKIILKNGKMITHFISNQESPYYQTETFMNIVRFIQKQSRRFKMKEEKEKLTLTVDNIEETWKALEMVKEIKENTIG